MEKEFVPYELAVKLKELGFNEPCFVYYRTSNENKPTYPNHGVTQNSLCSNGITAPTFSQAFRWFREKHNLHSSISLGVSEKQTRSGLEYDEYVFVIEGINGLDYDNYRKQKFSKSYEKSQFACLTKLIELVENKSE